MSRKPLGQLLMEMNVLDRPALETALGAQRREGGRFGEQLLRLGSVTPRDLMLALARQNGLPTVSLMQESPHPDALALITSEQARAWRVVPVRIGERAGERVLTVAMAEPEQQRLLPLLEFECGMRVQPALCDAAELQETLDWYEGLRLASSATGSTSGTGVRFLTGIVELGDPRIQEMVDRDLGLLGAEPASPLDSAVLDDPSEEPTRQRTHVAFLDGEAPSGLVDPSGAPLAAALEDSSPAREVESLLDVPDAPHLVDHDPDATGVLNIAALGSSVLEQVARKAALDSVLGPEEPRATADDANVPTSEEPIYQPAPAAVPGPAAQPDTVAALQARVERLEWELASTRKALEELGVNLDERLIALENRKAALAPRMASMEMPAKGTDDFDSVVNTVITPSPSGPRSHGYEDEAARTNRTFASLLDEARGAKDGPARK